MNLLDKLPKPFFALAPMDDVTDTVFRQIVADCAKPDLFMTEFVNVDGLQSPGRPKLLHKLAFSDGEKPLIAQIWGKQPQNFYKTTKELKKMGFAGVDINMGCPVKAVVKNGCCIALVNNRELAEEIITAVKEAAIAGQSGVMQLDAGQGGNAERNESYKKVRRMSTVSLQRRHAPESPDRVVGYADKQGRAVHESRDFPVSVKTRLGLKEVDLSWIEFLLHQKLNMLTIHGRTAKELSKTSANWEIFEEIRQLRDKISPATLLVGNGDVVSLAQAKELAKKYKLDGIMIGRGIFDDPFIFSDTSPWSNYTKKQKIALYRQHVELFVKTYKKGERKVNTLNKFCKVYINGFDGAKELREQLMSANSTDELLSILS